MMIVLAMGACLRLLGAGVGLWIAMGGWLGLLFIGLWFVLNDWMGRRRGVFMVFGDRGGLAV